MNYSERLAQFEQDLAAVADLAFLPISADLQYLSGVPRDLPTFGWTMHPGAWLEGLWLRPGRGAVLTLPRMTAEFGGLRATEGLDIRELGDHDDPVTLVSELLDGFQLPAQPRIATGDRAHAETLMALQALRPGGAVLLRDRSVAAAAGHQERGRNRGDARCRRHHGSGVQGRARPVQTWHDGTGDHERGELSAAAARFAGRILHDLAVQLRAESSAADGAAQREYAASAAAAGVDPV